MKMENKNNKNYNRANCPSFDDLPTECYIDDIMNHAKNGCIVLQELGGVAYVMFIDKKQMDHNDERFHAMDFEPNPNDEYYNVFWNDGEFIDLPDRIHYQWKLRDEKNILVWWDHDLGDVVIERVSDEELEVDCYGQAYLICDGVYFYWIT